MTRKEEIRQAALAYSFDTDGGVTGYLNTGRDDFTEGAEWADKHPSRKLMIKVWKIAVAATVDQINGKIAYLETENEIVAYIRERLKS